MTPSEQVLDGNGLAWALLTDFSSYPEGQRNLLLWVFTESYTHSLYLDWDVTASELVGVLQLEAVTRQRDMQI